MGNSGAQARLCLRTRLHHSRLLSPTTTCVPRPYSPPTFRSICISMHAPKKGLNDMVLGLVVRSEQETSRFPLIPAIPTADSLPSDLETWRCSCSIIASDNATPLLYTPDVALGLAILMTFGLCCPWKRSQVDKRYYGKRLRLALYVQRKSVAVIRRENHYFR
jgi:hypothetical protein